MELEIKAERAKARGKFGSRLRTEEQAHILKIQINPHVRFVNYLDFPEEPYLVT